LLNRLLSPKYPPNRTHKPNGLPHDEQWPTIVRDLVAQLDRQSLRRSNDPPQNSLASQHAAITFDSKHDCHKGIAVIEADWPNVDANCSQSGSFT
jgi:hypothetical protein